MRAACVAHGMAMVVDTRASVVAPPVSSEGPALGPVTT